MKKCKNLLSYFTNFSVHFRIFFTNLAEASENDEEFLKKKVRAVEVNLVEELGRRSEVEGC